MPRQHPSLTNEQRATLRGLVWYVVALVLLLGGSALDTWVNRPIGFALVVVGVILSGYLIFRRSFVSPRSHPK